MYILFYRGQSFRETYRRVGEIRSLISSNVNLMALTATASKSTREKVSQMLSLRTATLVYVPPVKPNMIYYVKFKSDTTIERLVHGLSDRLINLKETTPKILVFCRRFQECSTMYQLFKQFLGREFTHPIGAPDLAKFRVVDMYTGGCTKPEIKASIIKSFCASAHLRIVISTIAFGMGLDVPDIQQVILGVHWMTLKDIYKRRAEVDVTEDHAMVLYIVENRIIGT